MFNFLDTFFQKVKSAISITGTVLSTIGIITSTGPFSLFVSSTFLATSLFMGYDVTAISAKLNKQVKLLEVQNKRLVGQIDELNDITIQSENNLNILQGENDELKQTKDELTNQIGKLHEMHVESKKLIKNLVLAGDQFNKFGEEFGSMSNEMDETQDELNETQGELNETQEKLDKTNELLKALTARLEGSNK